MSQTRLKIASVEDARISADGGTGIVVVKTEDGRTVEIATAPETGLRLARATREAFSRAWIRQMELGQRPATEEGPNDPIAAQAVEAVLDANDPGRVGLWALGTPMPPVLVMPTRQLPALIASARQVLDDVGGAPGPAVDQEPGDRVAVPENTVRPAKVATAIGEEAIMVIATDEAGQAQALILELDGVDDFIERIRSAQSEARRQNAPRGNLN